MAPQQGMATSVDDTPLRECLVAYVSPVSRAVRPVLGSDVLRRQYAVRSKVGEQGASAASAFISAWACARERGLLGLHRYAVHEIYTSPAHTPTGAEESLHSRPAQDHARRRGQVGLPLLRHWAGRH
jgi:hypothetical protein